MKTYKFNELPEDVQQEMIEEYAEQQDESFMDFIDDEWYNSFIKECNDNGFIVDVENINWTGFNSQGDGAVFTGSINIKAFCEKNDIQVPEGITEDDQLEICRNTSHYSHEYTAYIDNYLDNLDDYLDNDIFSQMEEKRISLCKDLYRSLHDYYDELVSEKCAREYFNDQDYDYDINGNIEKLV